MVIEETGLLSPVSPLSIIHHLSLSSSGEDQEDNQLFLSLTRRRHVSAAVLVADAQADLKGFMDRASCLQKLIKRHHVRTHSLSESLYALRSTLIRFAIAVQETSQLRQRINLAMSPSITVLQLFGKVHRYEVLLSQGPNGDVGRYIHYISSLKQLVLDLEMRGPIAMESLQEMIRYLISHNAAVVDQGLLKRLHETSFALGALQAKQDNVKAPELVLEEAFDKVETEFRRILADNGRTSAVAGQASLENPGILDMRSIPPTSLPSPVAQLLEIVATNLAAQNRLMSCLARYEDVRGWKLSDSFQSLGPSYMTYLSPKALDSLPWPTLEEYIALWNQHMFVFVEYFLKPERSLFDSIFSSLTSDSHKCSTCFAQIALKSGLDTLLGFGEAFAKSQKEPQKIFKFLDMFTTLDNLHLSLEETLDGEAGCSDARRRVVELQKRLMRGACAVLWEFGLQVEVQREGAVPEDGGVLKLVSYVINYLKYLTSDLYRDTLAEVLRIERSWKGGSMQEAELSNVVFHIMESLQKNVEHRSQMIGEPALSCVFRMNNCWYIYTRAESSHLGTLLGDYWLNEQRERVEHIAIQYQREAWSGVLSHLSMEGFQGGTNAKTKELFCSRIEAFEEALADMHLKHSRWWISSVELREQIGVSVLNFIVPAYRSYVFNCGQLFQQKALPQSLPTAEALELMLVSLFQERANPGQKSYTTIMDM
ncbi:hypothetical protein L7F22_032898 [Adiantum nelumboides]|nr:hypothetical protein [Adiantum nelumboides]